MLTREQKEKIYAEYKEKKDSERALKRLDGPAENILTAETRKKAKKIIRQAERRGMNGMARKVLASQVREIEEIRAEVKFMRDKLFQGVSNLKSITKADPTLAVDAAKSAARDRKVFWIRTHRYNEFRRSMLALMRIRDGRIREMDFDENGKRIWVYPSVRNLIDASTKIMEYAAGKPAQRIIMEDEDGHQTPLFNIVLNRETDENRTGTDNLGIYLERGQRQGA